MRLKSPALLVLAFLITFASVGRVLAQTASTADSAQLEEVTVTAQKRSQSLQSAAAAITSVSGEEMMTAGVETISDVAYLFPGVKFEPFGDSTHLYVRGIGAEQDRVNVDQLVNMSMDGVLLPREMDAIAQFDVHDIELLPGPQGTLYGASSVGGVITIANNRPTNVTENQLMLENGNYGEFHVQDAQNFAINDTLAVRGTVDYLRHSAYLTDGSWTADTLTARLGLLYTPSDRFSAYLWALVVNDDSIPSSDPPVAQQGGWITSNPWNFSGACITKACNGFSNLINPAPNTGFAHDYIVAGEFDWHFDGFTVTDIPSYLRSATDQSFDAFVLPLVWDVNNNQQTNELKIVSDAPGPLQWLAGIYLLQNKADQYEVGASVSIPQYTNDNASAYGQLTYSFTDRFRAIVGARYSWTKKDATFLLPFFMPETSATWSSVDWKAGVEYDLTPQTLTYLTAQTGSSPGTLNPTSPVNGRPGVTDLTRLYSLTGGWKSRLLDNRLQFNNEFFYYDYEKFLIATVECTTDPCGQLTTTTYDNAPKLVSWGDQLDLRWLVTAADQLSLDSAYTSTKTGHWITDTGANLSDQTLFEAPQVTTTLGAQHAFDMPGGAATIFRIESHYENGYWTDFNTALGGPVHELSARQRAFTNSDGSLTYHAAQEKWTLGLWARNLENKAQRGPGLDVDFGPVGGIAPITAPRTFGLRFTTNMQ